MILVSHYTIWPPIPKTIFIKHCRVEIIAFPFVLFHWDCFFNLRCLFRKQFSAAYMLRLSLLPQRVHTTLFIRCEPPELTSICWCLCILHASIQMSPDEVVGSRDGCRHSIVESTVDVPIRLFRQFFIAHTALFSRLLHNLQFPSDRCLIFASHLATGIVPAIAIISRLLCLQGTCRSFKFFHKSALLSCCRNMKSAVHVPYTGWLILSCSALESEI